MVWRLPEKLAKKLQAVLQNLAKDPSLKPKDFAAMLKKTTETAVGVSSKAVRAAVTDPKFLLAMSATAFRKEVKGIKKFLSGKSNSRIPPMLLMAMIGYLESERLDGKLSKEVSEKINTQYGFILADIFDGTFTQEKEGSDQRLLTPVSGHASIFTIQMVAYLQSIGQTVTDIEAYRYISLADKNEEVVLQRQLRKVDIVAVDPEKENEGESWHELKSYAARGLTKTSRYRPSTQGFGTWGEAQTTKRRKPVANHRQFVMDWAAQEGVSDVEIKEKQGGFSTVRVKSRDWWFQAFKVKARSGVREQQGVLVGNLKDKRSIKSLLTKYPGKGVEVSVGQSIRDTLWAVNLGVHRDDYDQSDNDQVIQQATIAVLGKFMLENWVSGAVDDPSNPIRKEIEEFIQDVGTSL